MGGFHSANFVFRFPELTAGVIALSGVYSTRDFFGAALDGDIYFNSPLDYLAGLTDERILERLRSLRLFFCCGQGAWEGRMLVETRQLEAVLRDKGIPAWVDYLGRRRLARLGVVAPPDRVFHELLAGRGREAPSGLTATPARVSPSSHPGVGILPRKAM